MIISDNKKIKVQNYGLYAISANKVVIVKGKSIVLANPTDPEIYLHPLAITLQYFEIGSYGEVLLAGTLDNIDTTVYSNYVNTSLYLAANGGISSTVSAVTIGSISKLSNTGSVYVNFIVEPSVSWGNISGTLSDQTDLQDELNARVPYTGADHDVDLGVYKIIMDNGTTDAQMSPELFGVEINGGTKFSTLEYNGLNVTDSTIPSSMNVSSTGITFPDTSFQETAFPPTGGTDAQYIKGDGTLGTLPSGGGILHGTASGTDTYTVSITGPTAYNDGDAYLIRFTNGNTTGATLNINGIGAIDLYRNNDGLIVAGDITVGAEMLCVYNSTTPSFQCIGTSPNSLITYVTNDDTVTITKGQPVYASGGIGDRLKVKLAYNTGDATSAQTIGLVMSTSIASGQKGFIIMQGLLDGLSIVKPSDGWADGNAVYLGATAGNITKTKQYAPNHLVYLGFVTTASNGSAGRIYVRVQNGYEMDELHNVSAQSPSNNDGLFYNTSTSLWETKSIATVLGYTPQSQITLTTTGTSGAATLVGSTLNIPNYAGGGSSSSQFFVTGSATGLAAGATRYGSVGGTTAEGQVRLPVSAACTISDLYVRTTATMNASASLQVAVYKNGTITALTLTIAGGSAAGTYSNTANSVTFATGDGWVLGFVNAGSATAAASSGQSVKITI